MFEIIIHCANKKDEKSYWSWIPPIDKMWYANLVNGKKISWRVIEKTEDNTEVWIEEEIHD